METAPFQPGVKHLELGRGGGGVIVVLMVMVVDPMARCCVPLATSYAIMAIMSQINYLSFFFDPHVPATLPSFRAVSTYAF